MFKRWCLKAVLTVLVASLMVIISASCSSGQENQAPSRATRSAVNSNNPVKQVTIDVSDKGDTVIIPLSKVTTNTNTRFAVATGQGEMTFMAYMLDGKLNIRADICPPCRSKSFTLNKGTLVCDLCGTVFNAENGSGISGPCIAYPKKAAPYEILGDNIEVSKANLVIAYNNTLKQN